MNSDVASLQPVTRIRGQLEPTAEVKAAISCFLEKPISQNMMPSYMYTSAQAIVDQEDFRSNKYYEEINHAVETCQTLGNKALILTKPLEIMEFKDGTSQLLFSVRNLVDLDTISDGINKIPSLEKTAGEKNMLYVELAKGALNLDKTKRIRQIHLANELFKADLNDPDKASKMLAKRPSIVTKDMRYPVITPYYLPTDDHNGHM